MTDTHGGGRHSVHGVSSGIDMQWGHLTVFISISEQQYLHFFLNIPTCQFPQFILLPAATIIHLQTDARCIKPAAGVIINLDVYKRM